MTGLKNQPVTVTCLLIVLVTLACYWSVVSCDFVSYDDPDYFAANPHVQAGVTLQGVVWAFRTDLLSSRYPLTWLSFMLDAEFFGKGASGPHLTNLLLHIANTVLVFLLLRRLTGAHWRSAVVAALFALHPLRVEPVAWISERKGLLSTLFWLLTVLAYARSVAWEKWRVTKAEGLTVASDSSLTTRHSSRYRWLALLFFAGGLMSKPMVVTLPFALLLLDYWPLGRIDLSTIRSQPSKLLHLVLEKIPFFALGAASCAVTFWVNRKLGTMVALADSSMSARIENTFISYARYLGKTFWPVNLALPYPLSAHWPWGEVVWATLLVVALTVVAFWLGWRRPYVLVGWFWFLGTLVPVIGLIQWGNQAMADRFTYVPLIGLFIILAWGAAELAARWSVPKALIGALVALMLAACGARTLDQLRYWKNSETLFRHALAVTKDNYVATHNLGSAYDDAGRVDEALALFFEAVRIAPRNPEGQYNLGTALMKKGRLEEAVSYLTASLKTNPNYSRAHNNLGRALLNQGRTDEAAVHLSKAVELETDYPEAHYNLGTLFLIQSKVDEAIAQFSEALRLKPDYGAAHGNLGIALMRQGKSGEGVTHLSEALRLSPGNPEAHLNLGLALLEQNKPGAAAERFSEALRLKPDAPAAHCDLALALARQDKSKEAVFHYREALRLKSDYPDALNGLAWILATDPNPELRAGQEAVRLAEQACELTHHQLAAMMTTLAAAYAETGRFSEAVVAAEKGRDLAQAAGQKEIATKAGELLELFRDSRPFRKTL